MTVEGVDVSRHQRPDSCFWAQAHRRGAFAWIKGTEGRRDSNPYVDPAAVEHLERIRRSPWMFGLYHFARPDRRFAEGMTPEAGGRAEGAWAAETAIRLGAGICPGVLPLAIDLERYTAQGEVTTTERDDFLRAMIDQIEADTGRLPVVYTGAGFWGYQHSRELAEGLHARGVLLWLVAYSRKPDPTKMIEGWPWSFWQWSGGGEYAFAGPWPGLPMPIDRNLYRGTELELRGLLGNGGPVS